jgi:hypothetical protein
MFLRAHGSCVYVRSGHTNHQDQENRDEETNQQQNEIRRPTATGEPETPTRRTIDA